MEILTKLNEMAGFAYNQEIELYEVRNPDVVCIAASTSRDKFLSIKHLAIAIGYRK